MNKPLITIITSTLNSGKTLIDTINSVVTQTHKNIEFIILDGCSNDNTVEIIKSSEKLFSDNKIKYIWMSEQDKGIYDAWNKALKMASGDWVSEDVLPKDYNCLEFK